MPVDYSKWDALELSDDSDIEVHPNVDKRSFIRAKQNQIHQQRAQRRHQITTLKHERIINDGLLTRIDRLLTALKSHRASPQSADELVFQALIESAGDAAEDQPPTPPEGMHQNVQEQPTYSRMMAALVDQVKKTVDESKAEDRYEAYIKEVEEHRARVQDLQKQLLAKLAELEKEEKKHITSEDIHTGFDVSHVSKGQPTPSSAPAGATSPPASTVELLNPPSQRPTSTRTDTGQSSGADADIEDGPNPDVVEEDGDDDLEPSAAGKEFAKIAVNDYRGSLQFLSSHPSVLSSRETDALLVEAFNAQLKGRDAYARQCVHQALLLQYCRQLGRDGVALFFRRVTTPGHQAHKLFADDVRDTYQRIRARAAEVAAERAAGAGQDGDAVEQIQLQAVDPNTSINIVVPPRDGRTEEERAARRVFESFPPGLRRALEGGRLDEVNKVLGKMSVSEAEEVVEKLGEGGMLSVEQGIIDATTEEGKRKVEEIARTGHMPGVVEEEEGEEEVGDPE